MHRKPQPKTVHSCTNRIQMHKLHGIKKHHPTTQIDTAHTSLDKKCPSLKAILEKYKKNT
jgi:hypothetical protein